MVINLFSNVMQNLDAILLLILSFLFARGKLEITTVSEAYIPVYIFLNFLYILVSYIKIDNKIFLKNKFKIKLFLLLAIFFLTFVKSFASAVRMRNLYPKTYPVHDNPIQIEQTAKYLFQGKNPYSENYKGIGMDRTWIENPAVYHVITMPFYIIYSAGVLFLTRIFGYFDERLVHLTVFIPACFLFFQLLRKKSQEKILLFLILFFYNPFFIHFFISGRSDVFVYSLLLFCFYAMHQDKIFLASLFFGLAFVSKQSSWLFLPFFFFYLYEKEDELKIRQKIVNVFKKTWIFFFIVILFVLPFLMWDARGFIDGVYNFPSGTLKTSFPIMGYGFTSILRETRILDAKAYFPSWIFQFIFGLPVLYLGLRYLKRNLNVYVLVISYSVFLFIFWFFSRFFLDNYIGFLIMLFLTAELFVTKNQRKKINE